MSKPLNFIENQLRSPLTVSEVSYWKRSIARLLKIGMEFEFNLPDKPSGNCKGMSYTCPCKYYGNEEFSCWSTCLREEECKTKPSMDKCFNYYENICEEKKCAECKDFELKCISYMCSGFISNCITCDHFEIDCKNCEYRFDPSKNPDSIRQSCIEKFNPSGSYGVVSKSGVHNITTDGSLLGKKGMEVITTGRRVDYWEFYEMSKNIIDTSISKGAYINERCSIHMHALASYYGKIPGIKNEISSKINELERSIPEIILANLHQLFRKYQNAITWMTTGLDNPKHLTRWEKFRVSILNISSIPNNMSSVNDMVVENSGGNKYGWINYKFCKFDNNGDVDRLHTEVRVMDGLLSPSAVAAFACLYYSLFIKAVELSRYGVIEVGDKRWLEQANKVKSALMNNCVSYEEGNKYGRLSDNESLHKYIDVLVGESFELLSQVKHILNKVGPAYDVLEKLAENPCSIRRCDGKDWKEIENSLEIKMSEEGKFEYEIKKIIDTRFICNAKDFQDWTIEVSKELSNKKDLNIQNDSIEELVDKVTFYLEEKQANGEMIWAEKIGSMISI